MNLHSKYYYIHWRYFYIFYVLLSTFLFVTYNTTRLVHAMRSATTAVPNSAFISKITTSSLFSNKSMNTKVKNSSLLLRNRYFPYVMGYYYPSITRWKVAGSYATKKQYYPLVGGSYCGTNTVVLRQYLHQSDNQMLQEQKVRRNFIAPEDYGDNSFLSSSREESPHTIHFSLNSQYATNDANVTITIQDAIHQAQRDAITTSNHSTASGRYNTASKETKDILHLSNSQTYQVSNNYFDLSSPYCQRVGKDYPATYPPLYQYTPLELLSLGAVWYFPCGCDTIYNTASIKPIRLNRLDYGKILQRGDCLRIHFNPRRFLNVHDYNFDMSATSTTSSDNMEHGSRGVVLHEDFQLGFTIINKPPNVPVHMTVDNIVENVATAYGRCLIQRMEMKSGYVTPILYNDGQDTPEVRKLTMTPTSSRSSTQYLRDSYFTLRQTYRSLRRQNNNNNTTELPMLYMEPVVSSSSLLYIATPQRLDQNTTGLFVLSTTKEFSAYFAKILSSKTSYQLNSINTNNWDERKYIRGGNSVNKLYRCLVCILNPSEGSSLETLQWHREKKKLDELHNKILVHYLEPSIRAPKVFARSPKDSTWAECLLRIISISNYRVLFPNGRREGSNSTLATHLWGTIDAVPENCMAIAELEIELLTGRTHQIRGQLAAEGFPLVGDVQYGGATASLDVPRNNKSSQLLALQCCELSFALPKFVSNDKTKEIIGIPTDNWATFRLDDAWWSKHMHHQDSILV